MRQRYATVPWTLNRCHAGARWRVSSQATRSVGEVARFPGTRQSLVYENKQKEE